MEDRIKIGIAGLGLALTSYLGAGFAGNRAKDVQEQIMPVWREFEQVVENQDPKAYSTTEGGEAYTALDYHGQLESLIAKRDSILQANDAIGLGGWYARAHSAADYEADNDLIVFVKKPF